MFFVNNTIVSVVILISFVIHKEWLLYSLTDKQRRPRIDLALYKNELIIRVKTYKLRKSTDKEIVDHLEKFKQELLYGI